MNKRMATGLAVCCLACPPALAAVTNYTDAQIAFGFYGWYDTTMTPGQRIYRSVASDNAYMTGWHGVTVGTQAAFSVTTTHPNIFTVSIDGGAFASGTVSGGILTAYTGLSDSAHTVEIKFTGNDGTSTPMTGTTLSVTGAAPDCYADPSWGARVKPGAPTFNGLHSMYAGQSIASSDETSSTTLGLASDDYVIGSGAIIFKAKCTSLWINAGKISSVRYWVDGVDSANVAVTSSARQWTQIATGLDGDAEHEYAIVLDNFTASPVSQAARLYEIMAGGTGATICGTAVTSRPKIIEFGDSITVTQGMIQGASDITQLARSNDLLPYLRGHSGENIAYGATQVPIERAILPTLSSGDICVITYGFNDANADTEQLRADYAAIINDLLTNTSAKIVCRGLVPNNLRPVTSAMIADIVSDLGDPRVVYWDASTWTGVSTTDGTHPNAAGYATLAAFQQPLLQELLIGLPTVTTASASGITTSGASGGGNVTDDGNDTVTARGACWSTSSNPTTADSHTSNGSGTGAFTSTLTGLSPATRYHVRAYATNGAGTAYGADVELVTVGWFQIVISGGGSVALKVGG